MTGQEADEAAILEMRQKHLDASLAQDIDTLVETFTEDGVEMPALFQSSIDTPPQHVTPNPAPHHAQDFTLG